MAQLSASELRKYDWRPEVFIKKLSEQTPFELRGGKKVKFSYAPGVDKILRSGTNQDLNKLTFVGSDGNIYKISDVVKNAEFGGRGAGSGTFKEDRELASLNEQIERAKIEIGSATIPIKVRNQTFNIFAAVSTPGTPKSDFHLVDANGKEVVWLSHKDGKTEKDFQQWGGLSQRSEPKVAAHAETKKFIADLLSSFPEGLPRATTLARKIRDKKLQNMSAYGNEFGGQFSRQNVTLMLQGPVKLTKKGKYYEIEAFHTHFNGEPLTGGYEPVFMAIYKGDRSDYGVKGTRIVIAPLGCRKITQMV